MTVKETNTGNQSSLIENIEALDKKLDSKLEYSKSKRIEIEEILAREGLTPSVRIKEYVDVKEALNLPDDSDLIASYQWKEDRYQKAISLIDDIKDSIEQHQEDSSLDELNQLTHDICHMEVKEPKIVTDHDALLMDIEAIKEYAERHSKSVPERAFEKAKSIALDGLGWIEKVTA